MPTKPIKTTHWSPIRTNQEQAIINGLANGTIRRAIPRDALTGRPLEAGAQTMTGWYLPASLPAQSSEPVQYCHLPRAVTRVTSWDVTHAAVSASDAPETPTDEETEGAR